MTLSKPDYIHGYDRTEQDRLVAQAQYWRSFLPDDFHYHAGERVLEVGCGVGAVLGLLGQSFPGVHLAGIDREASQIGYAREHLESLGLAEADLRVGDAAHLPWDDDSMDHVHTMWVIEHLADPVAGLREAHRVLKPGGSIVLTETDYTTIQVTPATVEYTRFLDAFMTRFNRHGDVLIGRKLGQYLERAGFSSSSVRNRMIGLNFWNPGHHEELKTHIEYLCGFLDPIIEDIATSAGADAALVRQGYTYFKQVPSLADGIISQVVYRADAVKEFASDYREVTN